MINYLIYGYLRNPALVREKQGKCISNSSLTYLLRAKVAKISRKEILSNKLYMSSKAVLLEKLSGRLV